MAQGIQLDIQEDARKKVAMDGFNPTFGARPLIGEIRNQLSRPISKMIIQGEVKGRGYLAGGPG